MSCMDISLIRTEVSRNILDGEIITSMKLIFFSRKTHARTHTHAANTINRMPLQLQCFYKRCVEQDEIDFKHIQHETNLTQQSQFHKPFSLLLANGFVSCILLQSFI